jgi:hypothetical protein
MSRAPAGFDVVFLSVDEPLADELFARLTAVLGACKRLHGVTPMRRAYQLCGLIAATGQVLIADGDFDIDPAFSAVPVEPLGEGVSMRVWPARNPVNGLVYGYGGLKLARAADLAGLSGPQRAVDVLAALPGRTEFASRPAGTTRIDQSAYHAWKAGFRECAMLSRGCEYGATTPGRAQERIAAWAGSGTGPYARWAARGAAGGVAFAATVPPGDLAAWDQINQPGWLRAQFGRTARDQL